MPMRSVLKMIGLLAALGAGSVLAGPVPITLASDPWPNFVDARGGYLVELSKAVFEPHGYRVQVRLMPFSRATALLATGTVDLVPALYRVPRPGILFAQRLTAVDETALLFNAAHLRWGGRLHDLDGRTIAWMRGFDYAGQLQKQLGLRVRPYEVNDRQSGLAMLRQGRVDAFMDNSEELAAQAGKMGLRPPDYLQVGVFRKPLYFGFSDTPQGRKLKTLFDRELGRMAADGRLLALYRRMVPAGPDLSGPASH